MAGRPFTPALDICLIRAIRLGRQMYPVQALEWIFRADSESGHLAETKKDREILSKWGNALRQTFRTIATAAGVSEIDAKLLMNPAIPSVNAGYITRHKLLENHLRRQQQAISSAVFTALGESITQDCAAALARAARPRPDGTISAGRQFVVRLAAGMTAWIILKCRALVRTLLQSSSVGPIHHGQV